VSRTPDADLMSRVQEGDHEAFAGLVDRHKDAVFGYLCRLTGCRDRAEELAQDTFLRLYQSASRYRENGQLKAYLFRIATNLVRSEARRNERRRLLGGVFSSQPERVNGFAHAAASESSPHEDMVRIELSEKLATAISSLPVRYRIPLVLHDVEEWSYNEIARSTGSKEGTIKSRISRGRRLLRDKLDPLRNGAHR